MKNKLLGIVTSFAFLVASISSNIVLSAEEESKFTRYEAEDALVSNCEIKGVKEGCVVDYGEYSGEGFVGSIDYASSRIEFTVEVGEKGNYEMNVCYAIDPSFGVATFNIFVNDAFYNSVSLSQKKGWGNFAGTLPLETSINLEAGVNKVAFTKGYNHAELDYIEIGERTGDFIIPSQEKTEIDNVPRGYTRYEAEKGTVSSGKIYTTGGAFSGEGYVGDLDWAGQSKIDFKVNAPEDGEYKLRIAYAIGNGFSPAIFKVYNTAGLYTSVTFSEIYGWGQFDVNAIAEATISLKAGDNTVSLYKSAEFAQIDFIDIGNEKIGEYKDSSITADYPNLEEGYTRFEAEEQYVVLAVPKGIKYFVDIGEYSGFGYVGELDSDSMYIEIPVTVEEAGEYEIKICYAAAEEGASYKLYSGTYGRGGVEYFYKEEYVTAANGWGMFSEETIVTSSICLKEGKNFIIIRSGLVRLEIDYLDLGAKIGEYYEGTVDESLDRNNP